MSDVTQILSAIASRPSCGGRSRPNGAVRAVMDVVASSLFDPRAEIVTVEKPAKPEVKTSVDWERPEMTQ